MTIRTTSILKPENIVVSSFARPVSYDNFAKKLAKGFSKEDSHIYRHEAADLGIVLSKERLAIIVHVKDFFKVCLEKNDLTNKAEIIVTWKRNIELAINSFFTNGTDTITAYIGSDKFLVLLAVENRKEMIQLRLKKSFKAIFGQLVYAPVEAVTVGFGNSYSQIEGLVEAVCEANLALKLGSKLGGENDSYEFDEFGILSTFAEGNLQRRARLAEQALGEVAKSKKLFETLKVFFESNLSIAHTADTIGVHPNTVIYRLERIAGEIGLDPRIFQEAVMIKTALLIQKIA